MTDIKDTADPSSPLPLGEEFRDFKVPPGAKLKNAPDDYTHGSVTAQIHYWRDRARAAEARLKLRMEEIEQGKK